jgi:uncharacterized phosphosugar-binding protein
MSRGEAPDVTLAQRSPAGESYVAAVGGLLQGRGPEQERVLAQAASICAGSIAAGGLVHLFGVGHSALPVLELFPRYGSFVGLNPIVDPRLLWFGVGVAGGVPGMRYLEDAEGYADVILRSVPLSPGDVFVVFSHGLRGRIVRDAMAYAHQRGCRVLAISSASGANAGRAAQEPGSGGPPDGSASGVPGDPGTAGEGSKLPELVIDTGVPRDDTLVTVQGAPGGFGAGSTVVASILGLALVSAVGELLVRSGFPLQQSRRTGGGLGEQDWEFYEAYERSLRLAWARLDAPAGPSEWVSGGLEGGGRG